MGKYPPGGTRILCSVTPVYGRASLNPVLCTFVREIPLKAHPYYYNYEFILCALQSDFIDSFTNAKIDCFLHIKTNSRFDTEIFVFQRLRPTIFLR